MAWGTAPPAHRCGNCGTFFCVLEAQHAREVCCHGCGAQDAVVEAGAPVRAAPIDPAGLLLARFQRLMEEHPWQFARTMADNPHWYTLRKKWVERDEVPQAQSDFTWAVHYLRLAGYPTQYGAFWYLQLDCAGFFYWTMGSPLWLTTLINRKPLPGTPEPPRT